jgi:hypothetical protein
MYLWEKKRKYRKLEIDRYLFQDTEACLGRNHLCELET